MAYGKTPLEARKRVIVKRQLRSLGVFDFKNDDELAALRAKLKKAKR